MTKIGRIRFWQLMVGTGFALLAIGLVMIFLPPGVGESDPFVIEFFEASIEGTEIGLALIVLGLSCFLIGRKDLADLRTYQDLRQSLEKTGSLAAQLVAERVDRTVSQLPVQAAHLGTIPDLEGILEELEEIREEDGAERDLSGILERAKRGLDLLQTIKNMKLPLQFPG